MVGELRGGFGLVLGCRHASGGFVQFRVDAPLQPERKGAGADNAQCEHHERHGPQSALALASIGGLSDFFSARGQRVFERFDATGECCGRLGELKRST